MGACDSCNGIFKRTKIIDNFYGDARPRRLCEQCFKWYCRIFHVKRKWRE